MQKAREYERIRRSRRRRHQYICMKIVACFYVVLMGVAVWKFCGTGFQIGQSSAKTTGAAQTTETVQTADASGDWQLILVNRDHLVPDNYTVQLTELSNGRKVDSRIYPELQQMFDDARAAGLALFVREGYRTKKEQQQILDDRVQEYINQGDSREEAQKAAEEYVALPGTSEHELGLSVDINADTQKCSSDAVYQWLNDNAYKYGFIKRYPSDKTDITGISNEPWHYRYVGKEAAQTMKEQKLCLEEYLKN